MLTSPLRDKTLTNECRLLSLFLKQMDFLLPLHIIMAEYFANTTGFML